MPIPVLCVQTVNGVSLEAALVPHFFPIMVAEVWFFCLRNTVILKACCCSPWRICHKYTSSDIPIVRLKLKMSFEAKKFRMSPATKSHVWGYSYQEITGEFIDFLAWNKIVVLKNLWWCFKALIKVVLMYQKSTLFI